MSQQNDTEVDGTEPSTSNEEAVTVSSLAELAVAWSATVTTSKRGAPSQRTTKKSRRSKPMDKEEPRAEAHTEPISAPIQVPEPSSVRQVVSERHAVPVAVAQPSAPPASAPARSSELIGKMVSCKLIRPLRNKDGVLYAVVFATEGTTGLLTTSRAGSLDLETLGKGAEVVAQVIGISENQRLRLSCSRLDQVEAARTLALGDIVTGTVASKQPYGAFLQVGNYRVLLHLKSVPGATHEQQSAYIDSLELGQEITAKVSRIDVEKGDVAVTIRPSALEEFYARDEHDTNQSHQGVVVDVKPFGLMVNIGAVVGLVHVSKLPGSRSERDERLRAITAKFEGNKSSSNPDPIIVSVKVAAVDKQKKRLELSMR